MCWHGFRAWNCLLDGITQKSRADANSCKPQTVIPGNITTSLTCLCLCFCQKESTWNTDQMIIWELLLLFFLNSVSLRWGWCFSLYKVRVFIPIFWEGGLPNTEHGSELVQVSWASFVAQMVKNLPTRQETGVQSLVWEDPLEKGMAIHCSIPVWRIWRAPVRGVAKSWTWLSA